MRCTKCQAQHPKQKLTTRLIAFQGHSWLMTLCPECCGSLVDILIGHVVESDLTRVLNKYAVKHES